MMYSNSNITCIAPKTASALALAKSRAGAVFFFLICASAFSQTITDVQVINSYIRVRPANPGSAYSDHTFEVDTAQGSYMGLKLNHIDEYTEAANSALRDPNGANFRTSRTIFQLIDGDDGYYTGELHDLGVLGILGEIHDNQVSLNSSIAPVLAITNLYDSMGVFFKSNQFAISSGVDSVNAALRKTNLIGETETITDIAADIRDRMTNQTDFALGVAFSNMVSALAFYPNYASTNYNGFLQSLLSDDGSFVRNYGLEPLYYDLIYKGLPFILPGQDNAYHVPKSFYLSNQGQSAQQALLRIACARDTSRNRTISNIVQHAAFKYYDAYNTYQSTLMQSNLFTYANMLTWTNQQAAGISPDNFALQWFDSYNTKFQNMLLQYANAESMTNENITVPEFARRWYDTYNTLKSGLAGEYLINHDIIEGTNSFQDVAYEVTSRESTWKQYLPTWGIEDENGELELGDIQQRQDQGYKSEMDDIKRESVGNSEYIQTGLDLIHDLEDEYSDFTLRLEGLVGDSDDSLQLRITPFQSELVPIQEDYISFKMSQAVKDKLTWFWWVLDGIIRMGILSWSFFHLWGVLMGRDFIGGSK